MKQRKTFAPLLIALLSCGAPQKEPLNTKARLEEKILPGLTADVEILQQKTAQGATKAELDFINAELQKLSNAEACDKENAALEAKEREEKCRLLYSFDLKQRKLALRSEEELIQAKLAAAKSAAPITQTLASGATSRCQSCHQLIATPGFDFIEGAGELSSHPKFDALLTNHDPKTFGCQSCHQGNEAFSTGAAHNQMLWEPNTPKQAHVWQDKVTPNASPSDWAQSSCTQCHAQEMAQYTNIACSSDSDCSGYGEGYVCGTFLQRATLALEEVPQVVALAKSKGEDPEKAADEIMGTFVQDPRASGASLENAKFAALDAVNAALDEKKPLLEAIEAGRIAARELMPFVVKNEAPEAKTYREGLLQKTTESLTAKFGKGGDIFASLSYGAPTALLCVEEKTNLARVDVAPVLTKGKMILREAGCYGCHTLPGTEELPKPGPALDRLAQKTNIAWLTQWIANPKDFRPNTRMPNFFPEAIEPRSIKETAGKDGKPLGRYFGFTGKVKDPQKNPASYEPEVYQLHTNALKWREKEASAIAAYLMSVSKNDLPQDEISGDPTRGKTLFDARGCLGCHQAEPRPTFDPAQEVPAVDGSCDTRLGQDCNPTKPYQNAYSHFDIAPNLSNIGDKTNVEWLYQWIKDPKKLQPDTRMPSLRLSDEDAKDIASYLITLTTGNKEPRAESIAEKDPTGTGRRLISTFGCYQCHVIPGFEESKKVAPDLSQFGAKRDLSFGDIFTEPADKTWENWTEQKLLYPRSLDANATMPYSQLRPDEIYAALIALRGLRQSDTALQKKYTPEESAEQKGRFLVARYNCWGCHIVDGKEGAVLPYFDPQDALGANEEIRRSFGPPSLLGEGARVQQEWLIGFLQKVIELRPWIEKTVTLEEGRTAGIRMPSFEMPEQDAKSLAAYFAVMSKTQPSAANTLTYEQALEGRSLFKKAQCESCHPFTGVGQAPNLALAAKRLQGDWIVRWLVSPLRTPPGTSRMPPFFGDPDDALRGKLSSPIADFFEGDPIQQMIRLRDYVMVLGDCPPDEAMPCRVGTGTTLPASAPTSAPTSEPTKQ